MTKSFFLLVMDEQLAVAKSRTIFFYFMVNLQL